MSASLSVPAPAWAMRVQQLSNAPPALTGLEESLQPEARDVGEFSRREVITYGMALAGLAGYLAWQLWHTPPRPPKQPMSVQFEVEGDTGLGVEVYIERVYDNTRGILVSWSVVLSGPLPTGEANPPLLLLRPLSRDAESRQSAELPSHPTWRPRLTFKMAEAKGVEEFRFIDLNEEPMIEQGTIQRTDIQLDLHEHPAWLKHQGIAVSLILKPAQAPGDQFRLVLKNAEIAWPRPKPAGLEEVAPALERVPGLQPAVEGYRAQLA